MNLRTWVNSHPSGRPAVARAELADKLGVTEVAVRHWVNRNRRVTAERVPAIEAATEGQVTRHDLRPDLWPHEKSCTAA